MHRVNRRVLIVGAGASRPFGLPTGRQLIDNILKSATNDRSRTYTLLGKRGHSHEDIVSFASSLQIGNWKSIDEMLGHNKKFERIGKDVIAACLLECEACAKLFPPYAPHLNWYAVLADNLINHQRDWDCTTIVTFNYDRTLDEYLLTVLTERFGPSFGNRLFAKVRPLHVHGSLGPIRLFAQNRCAPSVVCPTTRTPRIAEISKSARTLKIIHEAVDDSPEFRKARGIISKADRLYFLGFGFHSDNMRRLGFPIRTQKSNGGNDSHRLRVFTTRRGYTEQQWDDIRRRYFAN